MFGDLNKIDINGRIRDFITSKNSMYGNMIESFENVRNRGVM